TAVNRVHASWCERLRRRRAEPDVLVTLQAAAAMVGPFAIGTFFVPGNNLISRLTWAAVDHDSACKGRHLIKRDEDRRSALRRCSTRRYGAAFRPLDFAQAVADCLRVIER